MGNLSTVRQRDGNNTLNSHFERCIGFEKDRHLSERSIIELSIQFKKLKSYCHDKKIINPVGLTAAHCKGFVERIAQRGSASQTKSTVWAIRKFGAYLALHQFVPQNPAAKLPHPKRSPREKLPEYLKPDELNSLLEEAYNERPLRDKVVICLLASVGIRPAEIASLKVSDINVAKSMLYLTVKGGWKKPTPISDVLSGILGDYLENVERPGDELFYNQWNNPVDKRWVLRLVRDVSAQAGLNRTVTPRILRHTFATYMADRHGKQVTRALLGHGASQSTDVYMHLAPGKFRTYAAKHPYRTHKRRGCSW